MLKNLFLIFLSSLLVLVETSFLPHFHFDLKIPSLILLSVVFLNLLEPQEKKSGLFFAFVSGLFLDFFSEFFFGFWFLLLLLISIFIKFILKRYVRIPAFKRA